MVIAHATQHASSHSSYVNSLKGYGVNVNSAPFSSRNMALARVFWPCGTLAVDNGPDQGALSAI